MISISKLACYSAPQLSYPITKLPHYILHAGLKLSLSPNYRHLSLPNRSRSFVYGLYVIPVRVIFLFIELSNYPHVNPLHSNC